MLVSQILKTKAMDGVLTLRSDASVTEAIALMSEKRIGTVVVSDDGGETASGILSERDIVRELGKLWGGHLGPDFNKDDRRAVPPHACSRRAKAGWAYFYWGRGQSPARRTGDGTGRAGRHGDGALAACLLTCVEVSCP